MLLTALSQVLLMHLLQWLGWIKDYDGGTLMECRLSGRIPYIAVPNMLKCEPSPASS